jgi:hypothetical protein
MVLSIYFDCGTYAIILLFISLISYKPFYSDEATGNMYTNSETITRPNCQFTEAVSLTYILLSRGSKHFPSMTFPNSYYMSLIGSNLTKMRLPDLKKSVFRLLGQSSYIWTFLIVASLSCWAEGKESVACVTHQ